MNANQPNFDRIEEAYRANVDKINGVTDVASYVASTFRASTNQYVAMPDGTIELIRVSS